MKKLLPLLSAVSLLLVLGGCDAFIDVIAGQLQAGHGPADRSVAMSWLQARTP